MASCGRKNIQPTGTVRPNRTETNGGGSSDPAIPRLENQDNHYGLVFILLDVLRVYLIVQLPFFAFHRVTAAVGVVAVVAADAHNDENHRLHAVDDYGDHPFHRFLRHSDGSHVAGIVDHIAIAKDTNTVPLAVGVGGTAASPHTRERRWNQER